MGGGVHHRGDRSGPVRARPIPGHRPHGDCQGQPAGRPADLGNDHPHAAEGGLRRAWPGAPALAGHGGHAVHQLGRQAVLNGVAGVDLHPPRLCRLAARRSARQLYRRPDPAGCCTVYRNGFRLDGLERHHHGVRLRTHRRPAAGPVVDHGAVGHLAGVGGFVHRHSGHPGPALAPGAAAQGAGRVRQGTGTHRPIVHRRAVADAGAAVRLPGRGHHPAAAGDRHAGGADPDPGALQFRLGH
ncbi:hypothetical protein G6F57_017649 [Rhizopus arrhizus]|nr:hypothetical protein G6F57_017649 [Rhizopus arrhizus]